MAFKRFTIDGYGQLELNNVAFRRDGRVEAQCALDATDFEDAVRNAISIGGDSDTIGCITGGIAEALYRLP